MECQLYLNGSLTPGLASAKPIHNPASGEFLATVHQASREQILDAIAGMTNAFPELRRRSSYQRFLSCEALYHQLMQRSEEFAKTIALEAGKPIKTARGEVARAQTTFRVAMEESTRIAGTQLPVDVDERSQNYHAVVERVPAGPCAFLTPFNFPLNLLAHKVLPAVAVGCPFVVRPSIKTPLTALLMGELLANAKLPPGSWSILPSDHEAGDPLITDDRVAVLSFTGSPDVGWMLKAKAGKKRVILELGNNSAVIVEPDADLADAIPRIVTAAFGYAGQSCISVQRIYLHESIASRATQMLIEQTRALKLGNPLEESTDVGPLIDETAALRVESWIKQAVEAGARQLIGGPRQNNFVPPTLLENVPEDLPISCQEAFGPVALISSYSDFDKVLEAVNKSRFGLQAGLFTRDLFKSRRAFEALDVGGLIVNDVPTTRLDPMPYGGIKDSGLGREGVRYAIEHLTEYKVLVTRYPR